MIRNVNLLFKNRIMTRQRRLCTKLRNLIPFSLICIVFGFAVFNFFSRLYYLCVQPDVYDEVQLFEMKDNMIDMEDMEKRFASRREFTRKKCQELNPSNGEKFPNSWEFVINSKYHLVWCNVFKAASTSWMYNFNLLIGYSPDFLKSSKSSPLSLLRKKYVRPTTSQLMNALDNSLSFIIVRHPLERLLSAYKDKFLDNRSVYFKIIGNQIIRKTRIKLNEGQKNTEESKKLPPTFDEFIRYILCQWRDHQTLDEHWAPIVPFCTPCQVDFDIILKYETLNEDQQYLIKKAKLEDIIKPVWLNQGSTKYTKSVIKEFYSQISMKIIQELANLYKYDLELFQYSLDDYLPYVNNNDTTFICRKSSITRKSKSR